MNERPLKIVILYHATENEYSISAHNQTAEEAQKLLAEWQPHLKPGFSLVVMDQREPHKAADAAACRACRNTVRHRSGFAPMPAFRRRRDHDR